MRRLKVIYVAISHPVLYLRYIDWITRRLDVGRMIWCVTDFQITFIYIYIYVYIYTGLCRVTTFRSTTDRIYNGGPVIL
jgi:hypothetical protein